MERLGGRGWSYGWGRNLSGLFPLLLQEKGPRTSTPRAAGWGLIALQAVLSASTCSCVLQIVITKLLGQMLSSWCLCSLWHKCRIITVETIYNNQWIL